MQYAIAEAVRQRLWIQNIDTDPQQIGKLHLNARRVEERGVASRVGSLSLSRSLSSVSSSSLSEPKTLAVKIARCDDGNAKIVEIPPGPPVLSPLVAEVYGIDYLGQIKIAKQVRETFANTENSVDIDDPAELPSTQFPVVFDRA